MTPPRRAGPVLAPSLAPSHSLDPASRLGRRFVLAGAAALAGCQAPGTLPAKPAVLSEEVAPRLGPNRTGYIGIQAPIVDRLRAVFAAQVTKLLDLGAAEIYVLMTSPGGAVSAAQDMIAFIEQLQAGRGIRFTMHNTGVVASAACYVFLAGQRRLSVPRGAFLFHEASVVANGAITSQNLQDASARVQQIERGFLAMLTRKTRLSRDEASSFIRRTVILNASEAQRDGVVDTIADFALPQGATIFQIRTQPARPQRPATAPG